MRPGEHIIVVKSPFDLVGFRQEGAEYRDTIAILVPGGLLLVCLFRVPLDGTVAENVLKHGKGGLNIDACRVIASTAITTHSRGGNQAFPKRPGESTPEEYGRIRSQGDVQANPHTGRWPTNLLLVHGPGCKRVGDKQIKPINGSGIARLSKGELMWNTRGQKRRMGVADFSHLAPDGTETVAAYDCEPDCPVVMLDRMSGELRNGGANTGHIRSTPGQQVFGRDDRPMVGTAYAGDSGAASRFYPQFASLAEALDWLAQLIGDA